MNAGRELDALIAEKVMGDPLQLKMALGPRHYSTDIAAAWEVVEKLRTAKYELLICTFSGKWSVDVLHTGKSIDVANADTAPHAICLAALNAVS